MSSPRREWLTVVRGLLALWVVLLHLLAWTGRGEWWGVLVPALVAVPCFFVLSGYVLAVVYGDGLRLGPYLLARAGRMLPAYWLALAAAVVFGQAPGAHVLPALLFVQVYGSGEWAQWVNPPAWSMACEGVYYLALPLVLWVAVRIRPAAAVALCAWWGVVSWSASGVLATPAALAPYFVVGVVAGRWGWRPGRWLVGLALVCLLAFWLLVLRWHDVGSAWSYAGVLAGPVGVVVAAIGGARVAVPRWAGPGVFLGDVSYGVYIYSDVVRRELGAWPVLDVAVLVLVAAASYRWVEVPARAWVRRVGSKKDPQVSPGASMPVRVRG